MSLFDELVEKGRPVEARQKELLQQLSERVTAAGRQVGEFLVDSAAHETRSLLKRLGMMTREDLRALDARLDTLDRQLDEIRLASQETPSPRRPRTAPAVPISQEN